MKNKIAINNKKVNKRLKYSIKTVLEAINNSGGIKTEVAKKLNCSRKLIYEYIDRFSEIKEAFQEEEEKVLDMAEGSLFALIQDGDLSAIFYYLNNKGKKRGYAKQGNSEIELEQAEKEITGVLITPGVLDEQQWEKAAAGNSNGNGEKDKQP